MRTKEINLQIAIRRRRMRLGSYHRRCVTEFLVQPMTCQQVWPIIYNSLLCCVGREEEKLSRVIQDPLR